MQKIISLFKRDYEGTRQVYDEVVPGAEWVLAGEGVATVKLDGTCCMVRDGRLYKRYELKGHRQPPGDFEPAQAPDEITGDTPGWVPVSDARPEDRWHREAWTHVLAFKMPADGTYELVGPKVQGGRTGYTHHTLIRHGFFPVIDPPARTYDAIRHFFAEDEVGRVIEGIVWHHHDGRMVKIKARDFGIKRRS